MMDISLLVLRALNLTYETYTSSTNTNRKKTTKKTTNSLVSHLCPWQYFSLPSRAGQQGSETQGIQLNWR